MIKNELFDSIDRRTSEEIKIFVDKSFKIKDKARALIDRCYILNREGADIPHKIAVKLALIMVDEILEAIPKEIQSYHFREIRKPNPDIIFWQQVKEFLNE